MIMLMRSWRRRAKAVRLAPATLAPAAAAVALLAAALAPAAAQNASTFGRPGGDLIDAAENPTGGIVRGVFTSDLVVDAPDLEVTRFLSVTLTGLTHTSLGELQITLARLGSGGFFDNTVTLTAPLSGVGADYDGVYTFVVDPALPTVDDASTQIAADAALPSGSYAINEPSLDDVTAGSRTDYDKFVGLPLSGTWRLTIADDAPGDTGSLREWSFSANTVGAVAVPEPGTLALALAPLGAALAAGAAGLRARRRRETPTAAAQPRPLYH